MDERAYLLTRCLRLEAENAALHSLLDVQRGRRLTTEDDAMVLTLREQRGLSFATIGRLLSLSGNAARKRYIRAQRSATADRQGSAGGEAG